MIQKKLRTAMKIGAVITLVFIILVLLAHSLIHKPSVQQYLLDRLSGVIGYEITTGEISLSLWKRIGLTAHDVRAKPHIGEGSIEASRVTFTLDAGWSLPRAEPGLADLRAKKVIRIELGAGLRECRRSDDRARLRRLRVVPVVVDRIVVADGARKHHDVARLDGKLFHCHGWISPV